jgi:hypothetical protein
MSSQGQSNATVLKEVAFQTCIKFILARLTRRNVRDYLVFDLNAGSGENRRNGANCLGTGPLCLRALKEYQRHGRIHLCDKNKRALDAAHKRFFDPQGKLFEPSEYVAPGIAVELHHSDNRQFLRSIPTIIRRAGYDLSRTYGVIISDDNGMHVPVAEIAACVSEARNIDVAIHLSGIKQYAAYVRKHPNDRWSRSRPDTILRLDDIFQRIHRPHWLISEPFRNSRGTGRDHFVLFGSSVDLPPVIGMEGRVDMYTRDSAEGRALIRAADGLTVDA